MISEETFCITDISLSEHNYTDYHFCRGNENKHKSRLGLIECGEGDFLYLNRKIHVSAGDMIFIPEAVFCYSEWRGAPKIKVNYISFNIKGHDFSKNFELIAIPKEKSKYKVLFESTVSLLKLEPPKTLLAYSEFYKLWAFLLPELSCTPKTISKSVWEAIEYININWNRDINMSEVAKALFISESKLYHMFKAELGQTPVSYLNSVKINYAVSYLEKGEFTVSEICEKTNFHSESYFRRVFEKIIGMNPSKYRKSQKTKEP